MRRPAPRGNAGVGRLWPLRQSTRVPRRQRRLPVVDHRRVGAGRRRRVAFRRGLCGASGSARMRTLARRGAGPSCRREHAAASAPNRPSAHAAARYPVLKTAQPARPARPARRDRTQAPRRQIGTRRAACWSAQGGATGSVGSRTRAEACARTRRARSRAGRRAVNAAKWRRSQRQSSPRARRRRAARAAPRASSRCAPLATAWRRTRACLARRTRRRRARRAVLACARVAKVAPGARRARLSGRRPRLLQLVRRLPASAPFRRRQQPAAEARLSATTPLLAEPAGAPTERRRNARAHRGARGA